MVSSESKRTLVNNLTRFRCRGSSGVEEMMKGIGIAMLLMLLMLLMSIGCATPYAQQWQSQLWQVKENTTPKTELGKLEMEDVALGLLCTELRQVGSPSNAFIGVNVSCRNQTDRTFILEGNPIQVVNASQVLVKPLPLDHVMYKLYGGTLREQAQIAQLAETSKPLVSSGSSFVEEVLVAVVNTYRAQERRAIITEMHLKEALPYDLYYQSFTPTSLPPGVTTVWTEYYPFTTDKITVMLQGQRVEDGITFGPPPPPLKPAQNPARATVAGGIVVGGILLVWLVALLIANT